jgi:hypothetical protein
VTKSIVLAILLFGCGFLLKADSRFYLQYETAQNGYQLLRFVSTNNQTMYCTLSDVAGYYQDFYLYPGKASQWYYTPNYKWRANCQ